MSDIDSFPYGLRNGSIVKVSWETYDAFSEIQNERWFTAVICKTWKEGPKHHDSLHCMLSYPAQLGFPHSMQKVQVLRNGTFKDLSSLQTFAWVLHETDDFANQLHKSNGHVEGNETGSDVAGEAFDKTYTPSKHDSMTVFKSERGLDLVKLRIEKVERTLAEQQRLLKCIPSIDTDVSDSARRPMIFLKEKVAALFMKPINNHLSKTFSTSSQKSGTRLQQGVLRCSADYTLMEFDAICATIRSNESLYAFFRPGFDEMEDLAAGSSDLSVTFDSIEKLCSVIGNLSMKQLQTVLIRKKTKKAGRIGKKQTSYMQIFGRLEKCSQNVNKPSLTTVGRSFSSSFVSNEQGHVPVLYRERNNWDAAEKRFTHSLQVNEMIRERLEEILSSHSLDSEIPPEKYRNERFSCNDMFSLIWKASIRSRTTSLFADKDTRDSVVGNIYAVFRYVLVQGKNLCREVERLCGTRTLKNFIK